MSSFITKLRGLFPAFKRDKRGVTAIEFAIIAPVFFYFMFAIIELSFFAYLRSSVEQQVHLVARESRTGNTSGQTTNKLSREAYFDQLLAKKLKAGTFDVVTTNITKTTYQNIQNYRDGTVNEASKGFGSSNQILQIEVVGNYKFFTPLLGMLGNSIDAFSFKTTVFFKNEYF